MEVSILKTFLSFLMLHSGVAYASEGKFLVGDTTNVERLYSDYQIEFQILKRESKSQQWVLQKSSRLCFSEEARKDCYHSIGARVVVAQPPSGPNKPGLALLWEYGMKFSLAGDTGFAEITFEQRHMTSVGSTGTWNNVLPSFGNSSVAVPLGNWGEFQFHEKNQDTMIKARLLNVRSEDVVPHLPR